jgi:hypothetical protein
VKQELVDPASEWKINVAAAEFVGREWDEALGAVQRELGAAETPTPASSGPKRQRSLSAMFLRPESEEFAEEKPKRGPGRPQGVKNKKGTKEKPEALVPLEDREVRNPQLAQLKTRAAQLRREKLQHKIEAKRHRTAALPDATSDDEHMMEALLSDSRELEKQAELNEVEEEIAHIEAQRLAGTPQPSSRQLGLASPSPVEPRVDPECPELDMGALLVTLQRAPGETMTAWSVRAGQTCGTLGRTYGHLGGALRRSSCPSLRLQQV